MAYFDGIKIGDRIWSLLYGWGKVMSMCLSDPFPISVVMDNAGRIYSCTLDGEDTLTDLNQTWFWDEVKIDPPPRPKRKIPKKVVIEGVYWSDVGIVTYCYNDPSCNWYSFINKPPMKMTLEWEEDL